MRLAVRTPSWTEIGAKVAGPGHTRARVPCQDAFTVEILSDVRGDRVMAVAVSDGAGSAAFAENGSYFSVNALIRQATLQLLERAFADLQEEDLRAIFKGAHAHLLDMIGGPPPEYSATAMLALLGPAKVWFGQIGDGAGVYRDDASWHLFAPPQRGAFSNVTQFLIDPEAVERMSVGSAETDRVALFTDGLQESLLKPGGRAPHEPFFDAVFAAWEDDKGRKARANHDPARAIQTWLRSKAVRDRSDDDKTLVLCRRNSAR